MAKIKKPAKSAPKQVEAEKPAQPSNKIKWATKPTTGTWPTAKWYKWSSECKTYHVYRVESQLEKRPLMFGAVYVKDKVEYAIASDPALGPGYPRYWKTLEQALAAVEEFHGKKIKDEVRSNKREVIEEADLRGLLSKSSPQVKKELVVKISREEALGLLKAIGYNNADKLNNEKVEAKLADLADSDGEEIDEKWQDLFDKVLSANEKEKAIEVFDEEDDSEEEEKVTATKKPKPGKKKNAEDEDDNEGGTATATKPKATKPKATKPKGIRGVGVIATIIDCLSDASKKNPVTKEDILKVLKKKFPDREEKAMKSTIASQIPSGLRVEKKVEVSSNDNGYWLPKEEVAKLKK